MKYTQKRIDENKKIKRKKMKKKRHRKEKEA